MNKLTSAGMRRVKGGDLMCAVYMLESGIFLVNLGLITPGFAAILATGVLLDWVPCKE
ncbi:hypothetical protein JW935_20635 [candidate division KSB1 bacterium]|nr:hypothetical protein [candidate division KSB1 bacterium]